MKHTPAYENEIMKELPIGIPARYIAGGNPIFTAYGCALIERRTVKSYIYSAVNLSNGKSEMLCRRQQPLDKTMYAKLAARIRKSSVRGAGRYEAEAVPGERIAHTKLQEILSYVFVDILPRYGYAVRENQIKLAEHIFEAVQRRAISLAESEVGAGKSHAYLVAAILAKRGRVNDFWLRGHYLGQSYAESEHMPIMIATSSIALQSAIVKDYIPELSRILMENDIIRDKLTCIVRKGKEHYLCEKRLRDFFESADEKARELLQPLLESDASCDLADAEGLTPYIKRKVCVMGKCGAECRCIANCRYIRYLAEANNPRIDFQITNHNYFLADILHRAERKRPLLPHYQLVVIDEAHKFLQAARQMYGVELEDTEVPVIVQRISNFINGESVSDASVRLAAEKLGGQNKRLFRRIAENVTDIDDDETERFPTAIDNKAQSHLKNISCISGDIADAISSIPVSRRFEDKKAQTLWELVQTGKKAATLHKQDGFVCWVEQPERNMNEKSKLCAIPKDVDAKLHNDIWCAGIPIILTSGTLSTNGDFGRVRQSLGIARLYESRVMEISKSSPFDYRCNALLYLSEAVPFPDNNSKLYILAVADEIECLIHASHGHAAVLFTSYNVMGQVFSILHGRGLPFPLFQMGRRDTFALAKFKDSRNGALFAAGSLWEGIDVPGDTLSLLVIVKLPFAVPDPIGEYEKTQYGSMAEYKERVLVPDMLVKLKQGFGRLIRTETDTGVCAILDSRANRNGAYHHRVLFALPACQVTTRIEDIARFVQEKKTPAYFG